MIIGTITAVLFLSQSNSLKEKRMILRSLKQRLRSRFNVAIAEVDNQDKWQRSTLALVIVGSNKRAVNSLLSHVISEIEAGAHFELLDCEMEIF